MQQKRIIDIRTITEDGPEVRFIATDAEKQEMAKRFGLTKIETFEVVGRFGFDDMITFDGKLSALAERECVVTLKPFMEKTEAEIHLLFSEKAEENNDPEVDILPITKGKINLFDVFAEELGLSLNPFPKSTDGYLDYYDKAVDKPESPFAVLKNRK